MRVTTAQLNPVVGDVAGNTRLILAAIDQAVADKADVLVTCEMAVLGYPPRDLLFREGVVEACEDAVTAIARHAASADPQLTVVVGHPRVTSDGERPLRNSASVCRGGDVLCVYDKRLIPGYDVFDEDRYFGPGHELCLVDIAGRRVGVLICEDLWRAGDVFAEDEPSRVRYELDPVRELTQAGCDVIISLNASPFVAGKWDRHLEQLRAIASTYRVPLVAVHQVGANDDLVFDGRSVVLDAAGNVTMRLAGWRSETKTVELDCDSQPVASPVDSAGESPMHELFETLVLGVRDYWHKTGNATAVLGLSGGIDSAITAVIAARALGPENLTCVFMPSRFSSLESREDAMGVVSSLGLPPLAEASIRESHLTVQASLARELRGKAAGVTDENIQARLRGLLLMAFSNARGGLVLATSNKSELAMGYSTLYGDMCGAVSVIGDVLKTTVYALSAWINDNYEACGFTSPPIPVRCITKAPTAELRPNQTDQDTLPPYEDLDEIVRRYIDGEQSVTRIITETALDAELIRRITRSIDLAQYKRDQGSVILKVSARTFGRGRPMPIVMRERHEGTEARRHEGVGETPHS